MTVVPREVLKSLVDPGTFARGSDYARKGQVLRIVWHELDRQLVADVAGSTGLYETTITFDDFDDDEPGEIVDTVCTCPVGDDCKHCVAVLLVNNQKMLEQRTSAIIGGGRPPARRSQKPEWRQRLDRIVEAAQRTSAQPETMALGFELHRPPQRSYFNREPSRIKAADIPAEADPQLHIRPLIPGAKNNWIKGQAGWHWFASRINASRFEPDQFEWFYRLVTLDDGLGGFGHAQSAATIRLDDFGSPFLWELLGQAADLDIPLVSADKQITVRLAQWAEFHLDVTRSDDGLVLRTDVAIDGQPVQDSDVRPIGLGGVYSLEMAGTSKAVVTLAPLTEPMTEAQRTLLEGPASTRIPAEGHSEFVDRVLPLLRTPPDRRGESGRRPRAGEASKSPGNDDRRAGTGSGGQRVISSDGSVDLPVEKSPHLNLHISYEGPDKRDPATRGSDKRGRGQSPATPTMRLTWSWTYYSPQRTFPLVPHHSELSDQVRGRDQKFEHAVLRRLRAIDPDAARTESTTLTGIDAATYSTRVLPRFHELDDVTVTYADSDNAPDFRELDATPQVSVRTEATDDSDWFDLGIDVSVDGCEIPFVDLFTALAQEQSHLILEDGSFFSLDNPAFDRLRELLAEANALDGFSPENPQISRYQTALYDELEDLADDVADDPRWSELIDGLRNLDTIAEVAVPDTVNAQLRPYQVEGFRWLAFLRQHHLGGILADDMGLGKTLQTLALIDHDRIERETRAPFLVVAPTSVVANWVLEARKFTPHLSVTEVGATAKKRKSPVTEAVAGADIVVTSYAVMRLDIDEFADLDWAGVIFDEAQFMKNHQAKTHRAARQLEAPFRLAITGTPMENSLTDVWSLTAITSPGLFPNAKRFRDDFVRPIESGEAPGRMDRLRSRLRPFMLRRTKDLVAADLPEKQEQVLTVELEPAHRRLYDTVLQRERKQVLGLLGDFEKNRFAIFRSLTLLRMLALDPGIVAEHADSGIASSKLGVLMSHLREVGDEGHRALVFSQFTSYLRAVAAELEDNGIDYVYLDGSTTDRTKVIEAFREGSAPVFLISLKAGGFGLTLTEADYVFLLDPWWNPAAENQAVDRTHRIGQTRQVMVYRLVAENTIEEKVLALQTKKAELFTALMDEGSAFSEVISAADIKGLLEG
ncbi:DEAD/DEAH box helicase [Brevibacterium oceani]|uniref:DEAD/DEAH box helicase n=1 Tax=Brevibacterium oceani TaxID=358099 RepID=UPI0015E64E8C|nr:DEAD/DEAH box helicase [Brevibacterium oceani]